MNFSKTYNSLKKKDIKSEVTLLNIIEEFKRQGEHIKIYEASMEGQKHYAVNHVTWGFDSVDESYYLYTTLSFAKNYIEEAKKPFKLRMSELKSENTNAHFYKENGEVKQVMGVEFSGFFVRSIHKGDILKPYFNTKKMEQMQLTEEVKELLASDAEINIRDVIGTKLEPCLMKLGTDEFGRRLLLDSTSSEEYHSKRIKLKSFHCWETGKSYFMLMNEVPSRIFKKLNLEFHGEEIEEEGDWKGWVLTNESQKAIKELQEEGWEIVKVIDQY